VLGDVPRQSGGYNKTVLSKQGIEPGFKVIATAINNQLDVIYARAESLVPPKKLEVTLRRGSGRVLAPERGDRAGLGGVAPGPRTLEVRARLW
jgi:hypothetical protein